MRVDNYASRTHSHPMPTDTGQGRRTMHHHHDDYEFARTRPPQRETAGSILASILGIAVACGLLAALALNWGL